MAKMRMEAYFRNRAIRSCYDTLIRGMKADKDSISRQCYAKGLISKDMMDARLSHILDIIQNRVVTDATGNIFKNFCEILSGETSTAYLAENLQDEVDVLKKAHEEQQRIRHMTSRSRKKDKFKVKHTTRKDRFDRIERSLPSASDEEAWKDRKSRRNVSGSSTPFTTDEEDEEDILKLGNIESVEQQEYHNLIIAMRENDKKWQDSETSGLEKSFKHLVITPPDSDTETYCCEHAREVTRIRLENRELQKEKNRLYLKLKLTKWERKERSQKLKQELHSLRACLKGSLSREEELSRELCYMDLYCTEAKAQNSQLAHQVLQEQERFRHLQQKCTSLVKKYLGIETKLAQGMEERQRYKIANQELKEKVKELEKKVEELEVKNPSLKENEKEENEKEENELSPKICEDEQKSLDSVLSLTL